MEHCDQGKASDVMQGTEQNVPWGRSWSFYQSGNGVGSIRKPRIGVSGRLSEGLAGPDRNPRVLEGDTHIWRKSKVLAEGNRTLRARIWCCPLPLGFLPSIALALPHPGMGLLARDRPPTPSGRCLSSSSKLGCSHSAPFTSLANRTCPEQSRRDAYISVLISPYLCASHLLSRAWAWHPQLSSLALSCCSCLTPTTHSYPLPSEPSKPSCLPWVHLHYIPN